MTKQTKTAIQRIRCVCVCVNILLSNENIIEITLKFILKVYICACDIIGEQRGSKTLEHTEISNRKSHQLLLYYIFDFGGKLMM